jgi:hypothetical protein
MIRSEIRKQIAVGWLVCALTLFCGCVAPFQKPVVKLPLARVGQDWETDRQLWLSTAIESALKMGVPEAAVRRKGRVDQLWELPPQKALPKGGRIIDGSAEYRLPDSPYFNSPRVIVFLLDTKPPAVVTEVNSWSPHIDIYDYGDERGLLVIIYGSNGRTGDRLLLYWWHVADNKITKTVTFGGENEVDNLSYEFQFAEKPQLIIHGIQPSRRIAFESKRAEWTAHLGMDISFEYNGRDLGGTPANSNNSKE